MVTKKLKIIVWFGGFHSLMNSISSIGYSMEGSGIERIIEEKCGTNTFTHISSGKAITRTLCFHFLVDAVFPVTLQRHFTTKYSADTDIMKEESLSVTELTPCEVRLALEEPKILKHYMTIQKIEIFIHQNKIHHKSSNSCNAI